MGHHEAVGGRRPRWRWLVIPMCGVLGLAAGILWVVSATPTYTANAYGFVAFTPPLRGGIDDVNPYSSGVFVEERLTTYAALATSTEVLRAVVADTNQGTIDQLRGQIQAAVIPGKVILQVAVEDADPQAAVQIADSVLANLGRTLAIVERGGVGFIELGGAPPQPSSPVRIVSVQPALVGPLSPDWHAVLAGLLAGLSVGTAVYLYHLTRSRREALPSESSVPHNSVPPNGDTDSYAR